MTQQEAPPATTATTHSQPPKGFRLHGWIVKSHTFAESVQHHLAPDALQRYRASLRSSLVADVADVAFREMDLLPHAVMGPLTYAEGPGEEWSSITVTASVPLFVPCPLSQLLQADNELAHLPNEITFEESLWLPAPPSSAVPPAGWDTQRATINDRLRARCLEHAKCRLGRWLSLYDPIITPHEALADGFWTGTVHLTMRRR